MEKSDRKNEIIKTFLAVETKRSFINTKRKNQKDRSRETAREAENEREKESETVRQTEKDRDLKPYWQSRLRSR